MYMKKNVILLWAIIMPMISWAQARSTILSDQPEGTVLTDRVWTSDGYAVDEAQARMVPFKEKDRVAQVVTNGKKVYIKNAISHYPTGAWIEGEMNEEGTEVTFKTPQPVMINPADNSIVYVTRQVRKGTSLATETGNTDLRFAVRNDSLIQTDGGYLSLTNLAGGLYGYVDYNIVIGKQQQTITTLPASAIVYDYSMDYGEDEGRKSQAIKVGFDGNDVYIKSPAGDPNAWLKGSLNDNKIVFANSQYAGADASMGYYMYFKAARGKIDYIDIPGFGTFPVSTIELTNDESVVFDYNPADKSFMTDATFVMNCGKDELGSNYLPYQSASFTTFTEIAATPADPVITAYIPLMAEFGMGIFSIDIPNSDTEGNFINQEKMYYNVYMDDKILQSPAGEVDIPYLYTDNQYIRVGGIAHTFYYSQPITDRIGVQSFYTGGGEGHSSNIVWYDVKEANSVKGVEEAGKEIAEVSYFDLSGRRTDTLVPGTMYVKQTRYKDGTKDCRKFVSK